MNWEVAIYKHGFLTWKRQIDSSLQQSNFTDWNPFHTYARMLRIGVDALSAAISAGSVLYPYCVCGLPLWSVPIRSQILKVKSSFTYDADAADEVIPYWLRTASASLRTLSTASVLYPPTKLMCRCLPSLRRECGYSTATVRIQYVCENQQNLQYANACIGSTHSVRRWLMEYGCWHR